MRRVVILGRGAAGKSVLAARLGQVSLPLIRQAIAGHAANADVRVLTSPRAARRFLTEAAIHGKLGS